MGVVIDCLKNSYLCVASDMTRSIGTDLFEIRICVMALIMTTRMIGLEQMSRY